MVLESWSETKFAPPAARRFFRCSDRVFGAVEGLYCNRPIQCLASSEILTPPPAAPHRQRVCTPSPPPAFGAGGGHTRWVESGWGVNSSEDARHCSVLYKCKYFVFGAISMSIKTDPTPPLH
jgi:hypothetical protein